MLFFRSCANHATTNPKSWAMSSSEQCLAMWTPSQWDTFAAPTVVDSRINLAPVPMSCELSGWSWRWHCCCRHFLALVVQVVVEVLLMRRLSWSAWLHFEGVYFSSITKEVMHGGHRKTSETYESNLLKSVNRRHKCDCANLYLAAMVYTVTESNCVELIISVEKQTTLYGALMNKTHTKELTNVQMLCVVSRG